MADRIGGNLMTIVALQHYEKLAEGAEAVPHDPE
jgi:hypothetical protein